MEGQDARFEAAIPFLRRIADRRAGTILLHESTDDLVQGILVRALGSISRASFANDAAFHGWLGTIAERHIADRIDHWSALKRDSGRLLRVAGTDRNRSGSGIAIEDHRTGPATLAHRRSLLIVATRALSTLPARDQQLVRWHAEGESLTTQAERLELSYAATQRAAHRALERLRLAIRRIGLRPHSAEFGGMGS